MNSARSSRSLGAATPATFWLPRRYNQHQEITATARGGLPPVSAFSGSSRGALRGADIETKIDSLAAMVAHSFETHGPEAGMREARRYGIEDGARLFAETRGEPIAELCARLKRVRGHLANRPSDKSLHACRAFLELRILQRRGQRALPAGPYAPRGAPAHFRGGDLGAKDDYGTYREYDTGDGYVYRQYKDGTIQIVKTRRGRPGTFLRGNREDPNYAQWAAITAQLRKLKAEKTAPVVSTALQTGLSVLDMLLQRRAPPPAPDAEVFVDELPPSPPALPVPLLWAGGALAVVVAALVVLRPGRG